MAKKNVYLFLCGIILLSLSSCATLRNGHRWGEDVNYLPGWEKIGEAAYNAITAPEVYVPLSGALVVYATDTDQKISDWASDNTPIFGSQNRAKDFSDYFLISSAVLYSTSVILTPGGNKTDEWIFSKLKGLTIIFGAYSATAFATESIKIKTARLRPDNSTRKSFPSGHTSKTAVHNIISVRNTELIQYFNGYSTQIHLGYSALTAATAWARIEGKRHYPTDVLCGAALGNFIGAFINDAFIGIEHSHDIDVHFSQNSDVIMLNLNLHF